MLATNALLAAGHGMLVEPRARNVVHNSNYCPHCLAAGGPGVTYAGGRVWPKSVHGVCGDPHTGPLDHEAGGKFATKVITGNYVQGQRVTLRVKITAPHGGRFSFGVCPVPDGASPEAERKAVTQRCFDSNLLTNAEDGSKYWWFGKRGVGEYTMTFTLPKGVTCKRCVLQWHYETGNSCTIPGTPQEHVMSANLVACDKTSVMEEFWNCADVTIVAGSGSTGSKPTRPKRKETFVDVGDVVDSTSKAITKIAIAGLAATALASIVSASLAIAIVTFVIVFVTKPNKNVASHQWRPECLEPPSQSLPWRSFSSLRSRRSLALADWAR